jgi:hypothetical protein
MLRAALRAPGTLVVAVTAVAAALPAPVHDEIPRNGGLANPKRRFIVVRAVELLMAKRVESLRSLKDSILDVRSSLHDQSRPVDRFINSLDATPAVPGDLRCQLATHVEITPLTILLVHTPA